MGLRKQIYMHHKVNKTVITSLFTGIAVSAMLTLTGCPGSGGGGGEISGGTTSPDSGLFSVTADSVYPTVVGTSWVPVTVSNAYYFKSAHANVSVAGTCSRGVETIKAFINGSTTAAAETATCAVDHTYVWQHTFGTSASIGDTYTVVMKGYSALDEVLASATAPSIIVDTVGPAPGASFNNLGTFTTLSANTYSTSSVSLTITGDWDGTQARSLSVSEIGGTGTLTATNCGSTNCTFTYSVTLTEGTPLSLTVTATDIAGNQTSTTPISVSYLASASFITYDIQGGASIEEGAWTMFSAYTPADTTQRMVMQAALVSLGDSTPAASTGGAADTAYIYLGIPNITSMTP